MKKTFVFSIVAAAIFVIIFLPSSFEDVLGEEKKQPTVVWYVVAKWINLELDDFLDAAEKYKPDIVLLAVFAEDDIQPLNGSKEIDLGKIVDELHARNISVYYSYSLYSRSMFEEIKHTNLSVEEYLHVSSFAKYLRENNPEKYHELFDYYLERGIDPEKIPRVERKPVDGYYVEIGHYSMVNPLYKPYQEFLIRVINETIEMKNPDGLAFDHIRFFTFDEGYNQDMRDYILQKCGLDVYNFTPQPPFVLDKKGWADDDRIFYNCKAMLIKESVQEILNEFPEYRTFGTTMGMIDPARANGQYVEMQAEIFDGLLLMAYDKDPKEVARNTQESVAKAGDRPVILGVSKIVEENAIENIDAGLSNGASGIYLLGYHFDESIHKHLLEIRKNSVSDN